MNGCRTPYIPTTFGPVLLCKIANNFLSKTVIQATPNNIGNIKHTTFNIEYIKDQSML